MMTQQVSDALHEAARQLLIACKYWRDNDQAAFDATKTGIGRAINMSLDEAAIEILAFVAESTD